MASYGGGGTDLSANVPASPWPTSIEGADHYLAAANTNPFTAQQQIQDWQSRYREISVALPPMAQSAATAWVNFLVSLNGVVNVFSFSSGICSKYPETLMNGSSVRYWRLKSNQTKWSIKTASIYGIVFELREAL